MVPALALTLGCGASDGGGGGSGYVSCAEEVVVDDASEAAGWGCIGPQGGTVQIPGDQRTELVVPPGALDGTTQIVVRRRKEATPGQQLLIFEPDGLTFNEPATLRITHAPTEPGEHPLLNAFQFSADNPERDAITERTNWLPAPITAYNAAERTWDVEIDHFSGLVALYRIQDLAYMVMQLPGWSLRPADIMVTLTTLEDEEGPNWHPGHVALVREVQADGQNGGAAGLVESTSFEDDSKSGVRRVALTLFRSDTTGHLPLGPRRLNGVALTPAERFTITRYAVDQQIAGAGYSLLGVGTLGDFSCAGLVEESYDEAGRGMFSNWEEFVGTTPYEIFSKTSPVDHIQVVAGRELKFPVYVAAAGTKASTVGGTDGLFLVTRYIKPGGTISVSALPQGATFEKLEGSRDWQFRWTPTDEDLGKSFELEFGFSEVIRDEEEGRRVTLSQTLTLDVLGHAADFDVKPGLSMTNVGATYSYYQALPHTAQVISAELVDLATLETPTTEPFTDHVFQILHQGYRLDANGQETDDYGISFKVWAPDGTVVNEPDQLWMWRVSFDTPDWRGDLSNPPP